MWSNISAPTRSPQQLAGVLEVKREKSNQDKSNGQLEDGIQTQNQDLQRNQNGSPLMRYKHAVCSAPCGYIYIHGGRFGNLPLDDDIWRFDPHQNSWLQLETRGCKPPSLQEHTLVEYNDRLYLFGGQVSTSNTESSFWCLDLVENEWRSLSMKSSKFGAHLGPTNRRGHSAVIYGYSLYIYGGFEDFRGSSDQLWEYDLLNERWELRNLSSTSAIHPEPRHSHSAIVHEHNMYIYGGLSNLKPLGDLWRWSWRDKRWFKERTKGRSPGQLHGHTAIQAFDSMFVFGGERNGRTTRSLWRLNLTSMTWQKIRPKGPRPNPTTWHGAIANPLSMLDETNYLIEGESELFKLSDGGSQMLGDAAYLRLGGTQINGSNNHLPNQSYNNALERPISHSKSSIANVNGWSTSDPPVTSVGPRNTKRKSRLSFLRRTRQDRPRSTYELKQIQFSASDNNFPLKMNNRHSVHIAPCTNGLQEYPKAQRLQQPNVEPETNIKILDNLDTDIKKMFQRAMSPQNEKRQAPNDGFDDEDEELMSVDTLQQPSTMTNRSQYVTARQADSSLLADINNSRVAASQRTSYAYTTPPSELNTLTQRDSMNVRNDRQNVIAARQRSLLDSVRATPLVSGHDRRDNRPKSEIVQSLIDRADAQIKHHFTPFFNQSTATSATGNRDQRRNHINRLSLDKSKRHTIPQTMTYYNLYFSEDKSSTSPPTSSQEDTMEGQDDRGRKTIGATELNGRGDEFTSGRMTRDDASSSTIRGMATSTTSTGTLVGVHGYLNPAIVAQMDQVSQLSLETANSSESRTLCGSDLHNGTHRGNSQVATFSAVSSLQSSLQNALTARRDTAESCDNTSLTFSMIAEFEEDDMLQYSSPTDPVINANKFTDLKVVNEMNRTTPVRFRPSPISIKKGLINQQQDAITREPVDGTESGGAANDVQLEKRQVTAHKSSSSGYDSMTGFDQLPQYEPSSSVQSSSMSNTGSNHEQIRRSCRESAGAFEDSIQENSSVHTESSFCVTTNTTETSPEQSALKNQHKKLKGRTFMKRRSDKHLNKGGSDQTTTNTTTTSSITADSLALTSDGFECSSIGIIEQQPTSTKSLPSSPPENGPRQTGIGVGEHHETQPKMPIISRSKLFGKQKSKTRFWQLCMFVIGGKQVGAHGLNEPINIWRLYI